MKEFEELSNRMGTLEEKINELISLCEETKSAVMGSIVSKDNVNVTLTPYVNTAIPDDNLKKPYYRAPTTTDGRVQ